jgi:hypothetical protein
MILFSFGGRRWRATPVIGSDVFSDRKSDKVCFLEKFSVIA